MFVLGCVGSSLCEEPIISQRSPTDRARACLSVCLSVCVCVCVCVGGGQCGREAPVRGGHDPESGRSATEKKNTSVIDRLLVWMVCTCLLG